MIDLKAIKARRDMAATCKGCERASQHCHNLSDNNCVRSLLDLRGCLDEIERLQKLNHTLTPICIYCMKEWATIANDDTEAYTAMIPEILEHVSVCKKNPLVQKIGRLQGLIQRIATDKGGDVWATFSFNPTEEARELLET